MVTLEKKKIPKSSLTSLSAQEAALNSYGVSLIKAPKKMGYQAIVLCVPHKELLAVDWRIYTTAKGVIYKVKEAFSTRADGQL